MSAAVDIGHGVTAEVRYIDGIAKGVAYTHPDPKAPTGRCEGWAPFAPDPEGWTVEGLDPLTISPSLLCRACGHHGHIRDGKWVPA